MCVYVHAHICMCETERPYIKCTKFWGSIKPPKTPLLLLLHKWSLSVCLSICLSLHSSIHPLTHKTTHWSSHPPTYAPTYLATYLPTCLPAYLPTYLSGWVWLVSLKHLFIKTGERSNLSSSPYICVLILNIPEVSTATEVYSSICHQKHC